MKKNIVILATGGTISGTAACETETLNYTAAVLQVENLIAQIPSLTNIAHITGEQILQVDSCDMTIELWLMLSKRIQELLASPAVDGVVVTHGTDTMEEMAYFLNLTVKSKKPVVLVGAMRPANAISADGPMNLYNGVALAIHPASTGKGILVTLNDTINCGRDVTKTNTALQDTFKSPDLGYLGYIQGGIPHFYRCPTRIHTFCSQFDINGLNQLPRVDVIYSYVGSDPALIKAAVTAGAQGLIYAGLGNGGMAAAIKEALVDSAAKGIVVVRSSRSGSGVVTRNGAVDDDTAGFVVADSLNPQKARILLMLALTATREPEDIQRMFWEY
ncbi:asparaginase [Sporomusa aerivorans]|uniref:asparaginase n=1 Tax=Sporomusa aerivorans TaxID=204936 RepID=UPI00352B1CBB